MTKLLVAKITCVSHVEVSSEVPSHGTLCLEHFATLGTFLVDGTMSQKVCIKATFLHKTFPAYFAHESSVAQVIVEVSQEAATARESLVAVWTTSLTMGMKIPEI